MGFSPDTPGRWSAAPACFADRPTPDGQRVQTWGLIEPTASEVAARLADQGRLPDPEPTRPWAAVWRAPGSPLVQAKAGHALRSGLFWCLDQSESRTVTLLAGPSLGGVVQARSSATTLDEEFVKGWARRGGLRRTATPYRGVFRLPPGWSLTWDGIGPAHVQEHRGWEGLPEPDLQGPDLPTLYRRVFDRVVDDLILPGEPLCATLSGGLDSSFVVASLTRHASRGEPIHAFVHSPVANAPLAPRGIWDPDDYDVASAMTGHYPELIRLTRVRNDELLDPLDVSLGISRRTWMPVFAPANMVWLSLIDQHAASLGASEVFMGSGGNSAFSPAPNYAPGYYLQRGDLRSLWHLTSPRDGGGRGQLLEQRVLRPLASQLRKRLRPEVAPRRPWLAGDDTRARRRRAQDGRTAYLRWLLDSPARYGILAPGPGVMEGVDPFATEPILTLAARITPLEWARGRTQRGFARRVAEDRLPDQIRLRTRRGGQSWDNWYWVHRSRDRYLDEVAALASTPFLADAVSVPVIRQIVENWPWDDPRVAPLELNPVQGLLTLAAFVRMTTARLCRTP